MKHFFLINFLITLFLTSHAQVNLKETKENRFKTFTSVIKNNVVSIPGDFKTIGHTFTKDWKTTAAYAIGTLGLITTDKITTNFLHQHIEPHINYKLPNIAPINNKVPFLHDADGYIGLPILGLYATSILINNKKGQRIAANATKSLIYSYIISHLVLKSVFARNRPIRDGYDNPDSFTKNNWDFGNFHPIYPGVRTDGTSFPSLHATAFFAVAKVMQMEFNNYWIPYTFIAGVFFSQVEDHNHWISDLAIGGLIGTIIGKSIVINSRKQQKLKQNGVTNYKPGQFKKMILPQISHNKIGIHFIATF
ncbi:phosphatase PAP2 family protein [Aquimarina agarilytica]|uniref:phosphatase PAP2 family protein n=1 Tax=Aquimarina agarilytica TaxID=1087449 RepID=UPI0002885B8E|nr:phosphatase PAP2 family protein [Aquimarina agarilytica]